MFTSVCLAAWVKEALLWNRKPILDLTLDWRCLMWVWTESLQSNQTSRYMYVSAETRTRMCVSPSPDARLSVSVLCVCQAVCANTAMDKHQPLGALKPSALIMCNQLILTSCHTVLPLPWRTMLMCTHTHTHTQKHRHTDTYHHSLIYLYLHILHPFTLVCIR